MVPRKEKIDSWVNPNGLQVESTDKLPSFFMKPFPFFFCVDKKVCRYGERFKIPCKITALKGLGCVSHDSNEVEIASNTPVATGI
jgi:hypothetical protein